MKTAGERISEKESEFILNKIRLEEKNQARRELRDVEEQIKVLTDKQNELKSIIYERSFERRNSFAEELMRNPVFRKWEK